MSSAPRKGRSVPGDRVDCLPRWSISSWRNAWVILEGAYPDELRDIMAVLGHFTLSDDDMTSSGGSKSAPARRLDSGFYDLGWVERKFDIRFVVDGEVNDVPTHKIDCYRNKVGLEIEWNNKDTFYDRDLNNFRLLYDLGVLDVGIIVTRCPSLNATIKRLGRWAKYGAPTTTTKKLWPKLLSGGGGGCPIVVCAIGNDLVESSQTVMYLEECP